MLEEAVADAVGVEVSARARVDVVVQLEIADTEIGDEAVDHAVEVGAGQWVTQVEVVAL